MEITEKERLALALLDLINKKREEIKTLTFEIIELEVDINNVVKIKQNIQHILNAVASSPDPRSHIIKLLAEDIFGNIRDSTGENNVIYSNYWFPMIVTKLENLCIEANSWNPIEFNFNKKGSNINITVNFPKTLNIASIVNYLKGKD